MGGEKVLQVTRSAEDVGSPPRGRGKAFSVLRRQFRFRITPAWAGKSLTLPCLCGTCKDHPRMGGEKFRALNSNFVQMGSPPRGRGKDPLRFCQPPGGGITPA